MTHATFAVLDRERNLAKVSGRKNRDYSIWDFKEGGRFYTVFPYFHVSSSKFAFCIELTLHQLAGFLSLLGKTLIPLLIGHIMSLTSS